MKAASPAVPDPAGAKVSGIVTLRRTDNWEAGCLVGCRAAIAPLLLSVMMLLPCKGQWGLLHLWLDLNCPWPHHCSSQRLGRMELARGTSLPHIPPLLILQMSFVIMENGPRPLLLNGPWWMNTKAGNSCVYQGRDKVPLSVLSEVFLQGQMRLSPELIMSPKQRVNLPPLGHKITIGKWRNASF